MRLAALFKMAFNDACDVGELAEFEKHCAEVLLVSRPDA